MTQARKRAAEAAPFHTQEVDDAMWRQLLVRAGYLSSTLPPASSSSPLSLSASSRSMPSLIGFGASSTSALASFRPRPVAARTTLMTWIFLSPAAVRTTSTVEDSSSAAAPSPPPPAAGAAAATAVADTPNSSSSALMRSASSATEMPLSSSIQSWVLVAISCLLLRLKSQLNRRRPLLGRASAGWESLLLPRAAGHPREPLAWHRHPRHRLRWSHPEPRSRQEVARRRQRQAHRPQQPAPQRQAHRPRQAQLRRRRSPAHPRHPRRPPRPEHQRQARQPEPH